MVKLYGNILGDDHRGWIWATSILQWTPNIDHFPSPFLKISRTARATLDLRRFMGQLNLKWALCSCISNLHLPIVTPIYPSLPYFWQTAAKCFLTINFYFSSVWYKYIIIIIYPRTKKMNPPALWIPILTAARTVDTNQLQIEESASFESQDKCKNTQNYTDQWTIKS